MYHFELVNTHTGETGEITLPEELTIEDFCRELRGEMRLPYTLGSRDHLMIDNQNRIFMQDEEVIENHITMLWMGGDDPNDPDHKGAYPSRPLPASRRKCPLRPRLRPYWLQVDRDNRRLRGVNG